MLEPEHRVDCVSDGIYASRGSRQSILAGGCLLVQLAASGGSDWIVVIGFYSNIYNQIVQCIILVE